MQGFDLDYAVPSDDLARYISLFYRFEADVEQFEDVERADRAQLRFRLSGRESEYYFAGDLVCRAPLRHVIGPTCGAMRTRCDGPVRVFGMGLTAAGWAAIVGLDASSVVDTVLDAEVLFGEAVVEVYDGLVAAATTAEMVAIVEPFVRGLVAREHGATLRFVAAVDDWLASGPCPAIDALAATTGLSHRQVERRCNRLYGAPPKLLARKYRALRAASALATQGDQIDPALLDGFYDQSHMIREIKQFAGMTPRLMRNPGELTSLTIRERRALDGQVHPTISRT